MYKITVINGNNNNNNNNNSNKNRPPRWFSGKHVFLLIMRSRVRSLALPQILNVGYVWNGVHPAS